MTRLADIRVQIGSMGELRSLVGALRSLAGMRVQEAQRALQDVRRYGQSMAAAIGSALLLRPPPASISAATVPRRLLILFAAEHGFVGGFNERLIEAARSALTPGQMLFVLGSRGAAHAQEQGLKVAWNRPMATRLSAAPDTVNALITELYSRIAQGSITHVDVLFMRTRQGSGPVIECRSLLPLDTARMAPVSGVQAPLHNLPAQALIEKLVVEYVFALLTEAAVESIASENAARFAAMASAHDNVSGKLDQLRQSEREARQEEITAELLDLITGASAVAGRAGGVRPVVATVTPST